MNLRNKQVIHETFGEGNVVEHEGAVMIVEFECGTKRFLFPDAMGTFLRLVDRDIAVEVKQLKEEVEEQRQEEEMILQQERELEYERRQRMLELEKLMKNHKLSPASQAVFWCEPEELDEVFTEWQVSAGVIKSGPRQGEPNRLARLHQNSACLITVRLPDEPEENRRIVGMFMVDEAYIGKENEDGMIPAHPEYRLRLTEEESQKMLFWKYYVNSRHPHRMTWNSGRHRYFDNIWMAQILKDVIELKRGTDDEQQVRDFFEHFCHMNRIDETELPEPSGALVVNK